MTCRLLSTSSVCHRPCYSKGWKLCERRRWARLAAGTRPSLQAETRTPRARTLSASFVRERTPPGELPPAQRQRKKNEGKARARASLRLDPVKHGQYLEAERARKRDAALRAERDEIVRRPGKRCSDVWLARRLPMRLRLLRCHRLPGSSRRASALRRTCRRWSSGEKSVRRVGSCRVSSAQLNA